MSRIESVGVIGAGVIGSGWIARFLLNGIDVAVYDPSKDAPKNVNKVFKMLKELTLNYLHLIYQREAPLHLKIQFRMLLKLPISLLKLSRKDSQQNNRFMTRLN